MSGAPSSLRVTMATHYWEPHVGGIESVARRQAQALASRGIDVEVHTTRIPAAAAAVTDTPATGGGGAVRVVRHRAIDPLARSLQVPVPFPGAAMARALVRSAHRSDVVVAHGHSYPSSVMAARAARRARRPFVLVQHSPWVAYGGALDLLERAVDASLGRAVIRAAARVVCVSEHTAAYVRSIVPDAATVVIPNDVDDRFRPSAARGAPSATPTVLFVGRLVRRNGWSVLLDAWRRSGLEGRAELHVVGAGSDAPAIRAAADRLRGVRLVGHVPDAELADRYRTADVVVVPTVTGEGFGLVAAEALACGTPVIASAQGGLTEVVHDGQDGILVPPGDAPALASALRGVLEDAELRGRLAAGALARARGRHDPRGGSVVALLDVLREQVDARRGSVPIGAGTVAP